MFESLALENANNPRRAWTTAASFGLEAAALGLLILAPLGYTEAISARVGEPLVAPAGVRADAVKLADTRPLHSNTPPPLYQEGRLTYGGHVPPTITQLIDRNELLISNADPIEGVPGGTGGPASNPLMESILHASRSAPAAHVSSTRSTTYRVSHLDPGMLVKQVQPVYPKVAVTAGIQGTVLLAAIVDTEGRITQLRALSGHPFLIPAAMDAVKQWRYRPYILNGSPVDVETQISVIFSLQR